MGKVGNPRLSTSRARAPSIEPRDRIPIAFAQPGNKLKLPRLEGERMLGIIDKVDGPGRFYITTNQHNSKCRAMTLEIKEFYTTNLNVIQAPSPALLTPGLFVACFHTGLWQRAKIIGVSCSSSYRVFFVDFARRGNVELRNIRYLYKKYLKKPSYSLECRLSLSNVVDPEAQRRRLGFSWAGTKKSLYRFHELVKVGVRVRAKFIKHTSETWNNVWQVQLKMHIHGQHPYDIRYVSVAYEMYCSAVKRPLSQLYVPVFELDEESDGGHGAEMATDAAQHGIGMGIDIEAQTSDRELDTTDSLTESESD